MEFMKVMVVPGVVGLLMCDIVFVCEGEGSVGMRVEEGLRTRWCCVVVCGCGDERQC